MRGITRTALILLLCAAVTAARGADTVVLENGLNVVFVENSSARLCSAVLVCPLPDGAGDGFRANASLLNRLLWGGEPGSGPGIREHEYRMLALRFGGSLGSQATADALVIHYTLPAKYLGEIFNYMAQQWGGIEFDPERLRSAINRVVAEQDAALTSSVLRQLLREIERRIWSDLTYRFRISGSAAALRAAGEESISETYARLRTPSSWTLIVTGGFDTGEALAALESSLGKIRADEDLSTPADAGGEPPRLGVRLQLPASLSQNHALLAYRLPPAADFDSEAMLLLAEYLRRSPGLRELREELSGTEGDAEVSAGLDRRRQSGLLYLYAAWSTGISNDEVISRLERLVDEIVTGELNNVTLTAARKSLLINYWTRRQAVQPYALWLAGRTSLGLGGGFLENLDKLKPLAIKEIAGRLLSKENRLSLVTTR